MTVILGTGVGIGVGANVAVGTGSVCSGAAVPPQAASSASSENASTAIMNERFNMVPLCLQCSLYPTFPTSSGLRTQATTVSGIAVASSAGIAVQTKAFQITVTVPLLPYATLATRYLYQFGL